MSEWPRGLGIFFTLYRYSLPRGATSCPSVPSTVPDHNSLLCKNVRIYCQSMTANLQEVIVEMRIYPPRQTKAYVMNIAIGGTQWDLPKHPATRSTKAVDYAGLHILPRG